MKNIFVINGSPKPKYSITLQTSLFLQKKFTDCNFEFCHVAKLNKELDTNPNEVFEKISASDIVIFSYPVYTFIAPYALHLFIEKLKQHNFDFSGKVATQITTSKHFYDVTAHQYIKDNALDLRFNFINGLSADMEDLLKTSGKMKPKTFSNEFCGVLKINFLINIQRKNKIINLLINLHLLLNLQMNTK